jgi:YVTN family beta-propeller protein
MMIAPQGVARTPDNSAAYLTNNGDGTVSVIDTATNTVVNLFPVGTTPFGIAIGALGV